MMAIMPLLVGDEPRRKHPGRGIWMQAVRIFMTGYQAANRLSYKYLWFYNQIPLKFFLQNRVLKKL